MFWHNLLVLPFSHPLQSVVGVVWVCFCFSNCASEIWFLWNFKFCFWDLVSFNWRLSPISTLLKSPVAPREPEHPTFHPWGLQLVLLSTYWIQDVPSAIKVMLEDILHSHLIHWRPFLWWMPRYPDTSPDLPHPNGGMGFMIPTHPKFELE